MPIANALGPMRFIAPARRAEAARRAIEALGVVTEGQDQAQRAHLRKRIDAGFEPGHERVTVYDCKQDHDGDDNDLRVQQRAVGRVPRDRVGALRSAQC
jgi:hypothetical protein